MAELKRTPLYELHRAAGAKLVPFAGFEMPVQYQSLIAEHKAVRSAAGLFDVSHMGEFELSGGEASSFLDRMLTNDLSRVEVGQAQYNLMLQDDGGVVDDLIVYRRGPDRWLAIVNAGNIEKDFQWLSSHRSAALELTDRSADWALLALQGPRAAALLQPLTRTALDPIKTYRFAEGQVAGAPAILARTGYTGEDGFELAVPSPQAEQVWRALVRAGATPCGLGARDTLRLEMKYALYGNDIDQTTNPLEAGLGWVVKLGKAAEFPGKKALERVKAEGVRRKLVGFEMTERGIPRHGYPLLDPASGKKIGVTTSGTQSPSLDKAIGVGYVSADLSPVGSPIAVEIRGEARRAVVVETPFYQKNR